MKVEIAYIDGAVALHVDETTDQLHDRLTDLLALVAVDCRLRCLEATDRGAIWIGEPSQVDRVKALLPSWATVRAA